MNSLLAFILMAGHLDLPKSSLPIHVR